MTNGQHMRLLEAYMTISTKLATYAADDKERHITFIVTEETGHMDVTTTHDPQGLRDEMEAVFKLACQ